MARSSPSESIKTSVAPSNNTKNQRLPGSSIEPSEMSKSKNINLRIMIARSEIPNFNENPKHTIVDRECFLKPVRFHDNNKKLCRTKTKSMCLKMPHLIVHNWKWVETQQRLARNTERPNTHSHQRAFQQAQIPHPTFQHTWSDMHGQHWLWTRQSETHQIEFI